MLKYRFYEEELVIYPVGTKVKINVSVLNEFSGLFYRELSRIRNNPEMVYEIVGHENKFPYPRNIVRLNEFDDGAYFSDGELILVS